jgi:fatty-acid desaturase
MNGTYWSHIGWIFRGTAQGHSQATLQRYSPDLTKDRYLTLLNNYYYVTLIVCAFVLLGDRRLDDGPVGSIFTNRSVVAFHVACKFGDASVGQPAF